MFCGSNFARQFNIKYIRFLFFIFIASHLSACSIMDSDFSKNKQVVSFNPPVGAEYVYEFTYVDQGIQEKGKSIHTTIVTVQYKINLLYKILNESERGYSVSVDFLSFEIENTTDVGFSDNLHEKDSTYSHRNVNSLKNAIFQLNVALDGKIENIHGYHEYVTRSLALGERPFDKDYFNDLLGRITKLLPDRNVVEGRIWKGHLSHESGIEYLADEYILEKISGNVAKIRSSSKVKQQLLSANTTLNGTAHEEIEIESNTGMPRTFDGIMKLSGACKIGGVEVTQTVIKTSRLVGHRIN